MLIDWVGAALVSWQFEADAFSDIDLQIVQCNKYFLTQH